MARFIVALAAAIGLTSGVATAGDPIAGASNVAPGDHASTSSKAATTETASTAEPLPEPGTYKPLTFWTKLKLGSAYYTNPALTQNLDFAYRYDSKDLSRDGRQRQVWRLASEGRLTLGVANGNGVTIEPAEEFLRTANIKTEATFTDALQAGQIIVVSSEKTLLGRTATETLVKEGATTTSAAIKPPSVVVVK